jgi:hypothetical protein
MKDWPLDFSFYFLRKYNSNFHQYFPSWSDVQINLFMIICMNWARISKTGSEDSRQLIRNNITSYTKQSRCTWMKGERKKHWRVLSLRTKKWERNLHLKSASRTNASSSTHNLSVSEWVREMHKHTFCWSSSSSGSGGFSVQRKVRERFHHENCCRRVCLCECC